MTSIKSFLITCMVLTAIGCVPRSPHVSKQTSRGEALKKITFDLNEIDKDGLIGPADGKHSVAYEFCIPVEALKKMEVLSIDSSVRFFEGSKGRIGCSPGQYLCIGEGGTRDVIIRLASLTYIERIDPFYGE